MNTFEEQFKNLGVTDGDTLGVAKCLDLFKEDIPDNSIIFELSQRELLQLVQNAVNNVVDQSDLCNIAEHFISQKAPEPFGKKRSNSNTESGTAKLLRRASNIALVTGARYPNIRL